MPDEEKAGNEKLLDTAKKRFKIAVEADANQRTREKDDLRFQIPEEQWDESAKRQREGRDGDGNVSAPARPVLSISKLDQPIQLVLNQEKNARLGVTIQPLSHDAGTEVAIILEGIYRRIERDSQASQARSWAFDRAVKCGRGAYRVTTDFAEYSDNPSDQEIRIERILHQDAVYFDPAATKPDYSDGEFAFVAAWMPLERFKREFPGAQYTGTEEHSWDDMTTDEPEWVRGEGEDAALLVTEYWYKKHDPVEITLGNGKTRMKDVVTVYCCKLSGYEVLETNEWDGKWIPLIPTIGRELQPHDDERRWQGIIGPAKDAQRMYNYAASQAIEVAALEPKAPFIGAEGQFEGHEEEWGAANIRNVPYLEAKVVDSEGRPVPLPQRAQVDVGRLGPSMQLLQQADVFMQTTTAQFDPALGRTSEREKSGRAILALQQQSDAGSSHYLHNLANVSMLYEAKVVLDLIPKIYDRPGRIARVLDEEGETKTVMLNQPFVTNPDTKMPQPAPAPVPPPMAPPMQPGGQMPPAPPKVEFFDLRKGIYMVSVSIGKQRSTALQEAADEIGKILESRPEMMPILGPSYFENREFPGSKGIAKILKKVRDQQMPFLAEDEDGQPTADMLRSQVQQMEEKIQEMGQAMEGMQQALETDEAKQRATLEKAEMDNRTRIEIAQMDNQTKLALEQVRAEMSTNMEAIKASLAELAKGAQREHDSGEKDLDRLEKERDREHETDMKVVDAALAPDLEYKGAAETPLEGDK